MDIKAEIDWIQRELQKVEDPDLIAAFKNLLNYRKRKTVDSEVQEARAEYAVQSEDDISAGKTYSPEEAFEELVKRVRK